MVAKNTAIHPLPKGSGLLADDDKKENKKDKDVEDKKKKKPRYDKLVELLFGINAVETNEK